MALITYPQDTLRPNQLNQLISNLSNSISLGICADIAQVSNVSLLIPRCTMVLLEWVEVWPGRCTTISIITELMNVHAPLGVGIVA